VIPLYDVNPTRRFPAVTVALIAVNVVVYLWQVLVLPATGMSVAEWCYVAGVRPVEVIQHVDLPPSGGLPWWATLFTSQFVHGGLLHLGFNMLYLWIFGNNVEDSMSRPRFLVFYLLCGLGAAAGQVLVDPTSAVPLVGASGAIAGVLGAYFVLFPRARVLTLVPLFLFFPVFEMPAWVLLVAWFVLQWLAGLSSLGSSQPGGVAYFAHVGGFLTGLALVWLFARRRRRRAPVVW